MPIILPKNESVELTGNAVPSQVFKDRTFYTNDPLEKLTGTYEAPILTGDAEPGNVLKNKTFYTVDPTQKLTGTYEPPVLSGDADPGNVMLGKTFYKDDPSQKLTGTYEPEEPPVLDGTALTGEVLAGKTFYKDDAYTKLVGTIPSKAAATITPGTTNQVIAAGQYLSGSQTIAGSANLVAGNIREDINLFGVVGTLKPPLALNASQLKLRATNPTSGGVLDLVNPTTGDLADGATITDLLFAVGQSTIINPPATLSSSGQFAIIATGSSTVSLTNNFTMDSYTNATYLVYNPHKEAITISGGDVRKIIRFIT